MKVLYALLLATTTIVGSTLQAQTTALGGKVCGEGNAPLPYANISLLKADSSFISGTMTDPTGTFHLSNRLEGKLVAISFLGYEKVIYTVDKLPKIITLKSRSNKIKDVVVRGKRPLVKMEQGVLKLGVKGTILSEYSEITTILNQVPGISADIRGNIKLILGGNLLIELDGREVHNLEEVLNLDPKRIADISLDYSAKARYRGAIDAVLRITTVSPLSGISVMARLRGAYNDYAGDTEVLHLGYATTKASYRLQLAHADYTSHKVNEIRYNQINPIDQTPGTLNSTTTDKGLKKQNQVVLSTDFSPRKGLNFGALYDYQGNNTSLDLDGTTEYKSLNTLRASLRTTNPNGLDKRDQHTLNLYLTAQLAKSLQFNLTADGIFKTQEREQHNYEEDLLNKKTDIYNLTTDTHYKLFQTRPTLSWSLSGTRRLELGFDVQHISSQSDQLSGATTSNKYSTTDFTYAPFASYSAVIKGWRATADLRYEFLQNKLDNALRPTESLERKFANLFISFSVSGNIGKTSHSLILKSKAERPSLSILSNNTFRVDRYILQEGNPYLTVARLYTLSYNFIYGNFYASLNGVYAKDPFSSSIKPRTDGMGYIISNDNYKSSTTIKAVINYNKTWGWYNLIATGVYMQEFFDGAREGVHTKRTPLLYGKLAHNFSIGRKCLLSIDYAYQSKLSSGPFEANEKHSLNASASYKLLKDRLQIEAFVSDLFATPVIATTDMWGASLYSKTKNNGRMLGVTVVYRFNQELKYKGKNTGSEAAALL